MTNEGYSHGVRGLLAKACDVLNQGFQGIGRARDAFAQGNGKDIVDSSSIKVNHLSSSCVSVCPSVFLCSSVLLSGIVSSSCFGLLRTAIVA